MPTKDVKGREIIVRVRGKAGDAAEPADGDDRTGRGMIPPPRPLAKAYRRRIRPETGFKIYDTALKLVDGSYVDNLYRFDIVATPRGSLSNNIDLNGPALAQYTALADTLFAVPVEDWPSTYKKLTTELMRSAAYRVFFGAGGDSINSGNPAESAFDGDQMKAPENVLNSANIFLSVTQTGLSATGRFFEQSIKIKGAGSVKFTATRDYSAAAVDYEPENGDEIFLIPALAYRFGSFVTNAPNARYERYYDDWRPVARKPTVEPGPHYLQPLRASLMFGSTQGDGYAGAFRIIDLFKSTPDSPTGWRHTAGLGGSYAITSISPFAVPDPAYWPPAGPGPLVQSVEAGWFPQNVEPTGGRLVVVIKKGSSFFYGWV